MPNPFWARVRRYYIAGLLFEEMSAPSDTMTNPASGSPDKWDRRAAGPLNGQAIRQSSAV